MGGGWCKQGWSLECALLALLARGAGGAAGSQGQEGRQALFF